MTTTTTASWTEFTTAAPELAHAVEGRFTSHLHHVLGTLRRDGSPRLSGTEVEFHGDHVWLGMMPGSRKASDLRRDPRYSLHSAPVETDLADGDARLSGRAVELTDRAELAALLAAVGHADQAEGALVFRLELTEVVLTRVRGDELIVDSWNPGSPPRRFSRR